MFIAYAKDSTNMLLKNGNASSPEKNDLPSVRSIFSLFFFLSRSKTVSLSHNGVLLSDQTVTSINHMKSRTKKKKNLFPVN